MKLDVSLVSFVLVLVVAIPVTTLRSQTYSVGYEIAELKAKERELRAKGLQLSANLALTKAHIFSNNTEMMLPSMAKIVTQIPEETKK